MSTDRTTEILHYLSAMSRDIGEFRTAMQTQINDLRTKVDGLDTEVGGLRTEVGALRTEVGALRTEVSGLRTEVGEIRVEMQTGFGELRKEVRALSNGLARFQARALETHADVDELDIRVSALEGKQE